MTSVPTDIDNGKQYFMMSTELEGFVNLGDTSEKTKSSWSVEISTPDWRQEFSIIFIETHEAGYTLCVRVGGEIERLTSILLQSSFLTTSIARESFKSKVLKLESDRAYLELLR